MPSPPNRFPGERDRMVRPEMTREQRRKVAKRVRLAREGKCDEEQPASADEPEKE